MGVNAFRFRDSTQKRLLEFDKDMRFVEHCKSVILPTKFRFADNGEKNGMRSVAGEQWLKQ